MARSKGDRVSRPPERCPDRTARRRMPQPDAALLAYRREQLPVPAERHVAHGALMTSQKLENPSGPLNRAEQNRPSFRSRARSLRLEAEQQGQIEPLILLSFGAAHECAGGVEELPLIRRQEALPPFGPLLRGGEPGAAVQHSRVTVVPHPLTRVVREAAMDLKSLSILVEPAPQQRPLANKGLV